MIFFLVISYLCHAESDVKTKRKYLYNALSVTRATKKKKIECIFLMKNTLFPTYQLSYDAKKTEF